MAIGIFIFLWSIRKKINIAGMMFSVYLIFNGMERFVIEFIRVNPQYKFLGLDFSQAQVIALGLISLGVIGLFFSYHRHRKVIAS